MTIILLLGVFSLAPIARMTRAEFLRLKYAEFVEAARCIGATRRTSCSATSCRTRCHRLIVLVALGIGGAVLAEAMVELPRLRRPDRVRWGQIALLQLRGAESRALGLAGARCRDLPDRARLQPPGRRPDRCLQSPCPRAEQAPARPASRAAALGRRTEGALPHARRRGAARWTASTSRSAPGETLGIVGESGSGKTVSSLAVAAPGAAAGADRGRPRRVRGRGPAAQPDSEMTQSCGAADRHGLPEPGHSLNPI